MNLSDIPPALIEKLNGLEPHLRETIRGQHHLLPRVASVLHRGELGFSKSNRPKGSFLFLGPTGVGKTELTLTFTRYLFGEQQLLRFDMSEYQTQESLGILLGGKLGETGTLGLAVKRAGFGTLLFDESEKAHPRILDILLQVLDAARITLASGETLDLSGFYVVLTSNLGAAEVMQLQHAPFATMERHVLSKAQRTFRPEFFARIAEKLVFNRLSYDVQLAIARDLLDSELRFLAEKGITAVCDEAVLPFLVRRGFHSHLGARPLRDTVEKHVRDAIGSALLGGSNESHIHLGIRENCLVGRADRVLASWLMRSDVAAQPVEAATSSAKRAPKSSARRADSGGGAGNLSEQSRSLWAAAGRLSQRFYGFTLATREEPLRVVCA